MYKILGIVHFNPNNNRDKNFIIQNKKTKMNESIKIPNMPEYFGENFALSFLAKELKCKETEIEIPDYIKIN